MYYYHVLAQIYLHVCQVEFSDFVVWTLHGLHAERIYVAQEFFTDVLNKVEELYKICLLPELIGKWYTRQSVMPESPSSSLSNTSCSGTPKPDSYKFCYCKEMKP